MLAEQRFEGLGAELLLALDEHDDADRKLVAERPQRRDVRHHARLVVGGAPRVEATVALDRLERVGLPLREVAARLDVNAVVERVDLARITEQVLDEVDVGHIVRESSGAMAAETVDAVRMQGMRVDGFLSRVVDRLLARPGGRDTGPLPLPDVMGIERA